MISLTCTSCKRSLEIDDAFAGGVCRCQFCGTIQTVPASYKKGGRPSTPVGKSPGTQKALYERQKASPKSATTTGVQPEIPQASEPEPAEEPRTARAAQPTPAAAGVSKNTWLIGIVVATAFVIGVIGVIAWIAL